MESDNKVWLVVLLISLAILFCGIYVLANPGTVVMTVGIIMVVYAVMDIIEEIIFIKKVKNLE